MFQVKSYLLILQIIILMIAAFFIQGGNATFQLSVNNRVKGSNAITLRCRNDSGVLEPRAVFFLNGTELTRANYPSFMDQDGQPDGVTFQINRQLEGMYSCGIGQARSDPTSLITYPTSDVSVLRKKNSYYAVTGGTAVLECAVPPGALIHYYHVTWQNGSRTLFRQTLPSQRNSTFPDSVDPRYQLDPMNLSLIIDKVRRSDSIQDYHCVLQVVDPATGCTDEYRVASNVKISLTVLSPPIITEPPIEGTVRQDENAIFSCKAEGYPLPTISWMHKGMIVTEHHPDYLVSPSINKENTTFSSDLRIFSTRVLWTGEVTCIASADSPEHSGIVLADHSANTSLTVLGTFRKFDVLISTEGDVIFSLMLPTEYNQSIHLFLKYTNDRDPTQSYNRTTEIGFLNTKSVQYMEYSSQVYYERFRIEAGLVSGSREVLGPLSTAPGVFDTTKTTFCESGFDPQYAIIFSVFTALFFILCIVLVVVICFVVLKKDKDLLRVMKSLKEYLLELEQKNSDASQIELEQKNSRSEAVQTAKPQSESPALSEERVRIDGSEPKSGDQPKGELEPNVKDDAHHGTSKSSVSYKRSTRKTDYKSDPVYSGMKKVFKGADLPDRKYKMVKKELIKECKTPLLPQV